MLASRGVSYYTSGEAPSGIPIVPIQAPVLATVVIQLVKVRSSTQGMRAIRLWGLGLRDNWKKVD